MTKNIQWSPPLINICVSGKKLCHCRVETICIRNQSLVLVKLGKVQYLRYLSTQILKYITRVHEPITDAKWAYL